MSRALRYFRLQLKRFVRQIPVVLMLSALLIGIMGAFFFGVFTDNKNDEKNTMIKLGIVGDSEESYLEMAINALRNMDSSRFSLSIVNVDDEEQAANMIRRGDLVAYLVVPEDFFAKAMDGDVQKLTCVTASGATDFGTQIAQELMKTVSGFVENSQKVVYGFQNAAMDNGIRPNKAYELGLEVVLDDVNMLLKRDTAYEIKEIGVGDTTNDNSLLSGVLVLFLMLWGITCCTVFHARSTALNKVLSSKGTGAVSQVLSEYAAYLVFMLATVSFFTLAVMLAFPLISGGNIIAFGPAEMIAGISLPVIVISSMQFFLYELSDSLVPGVLLQFFAAMSIGYVSGCIYPSVMLPRAVQDIAAWLPAWNCRLWLGHMLSGEVSGGLLAILIGFFVLFILLSTAVRGMRTSGKGGAA